MYNKGNKMAKKDWKCGGGGGVAGGGIYGLGFLGALIYYIQNATDFLDGVLGFLKALVWPAMLVYEALKFFQM